MPACSATRHATGSRGLTKLQPTRPTAKEQRAEVSSEESRQHRLGRLAQFCQGHREQTLDLYERPTPDRRRRCGRRAVPAPRTSTGTGSPRCAAPRPAPGPPTRRTTSRTDRRPREALCGNRFHLPAPIRRWLGPGRPRTGRARPTPDRRATPSSAPRPAASRAAGRPPAAARPDGRRSPAPRWSRRIRRACRPAAAGFRPARLPSAVGMRRATSSMTPSTPTTGRGQDRRRPGLVVEADVAAGDRNPQGRTAIGEAAHRLRELPHHARGPRASRS